MSLPIHEVAQEVQYSEVTEGEPKALDRAIRRSVVVIVAPPWPRSGTACVIKNQIDYYHMRGFDTVLIIVPFHWWFMEANPVWSEVREGFNELGAHQLFIAPLEPRRYTFAKYATSLRHAFRGTALDWESAMAKSARLREDLVQFLKAHSVSLFHVNYVQTLGFASRLRSRLERETSSIPIIVETHDIQSHLLHERHEPNPWTQKPDLLGRLIHAELSLLRRSDVFVHLSVDDFHFFQNRLPGKLHFLTLPAIDDRFVANVRAASPFSVPIDILFIGQKHFPNLEALKWFLEEAWPLLAKNQYSLKIVGPVDVLLRERLPQLFETFQSCFVGLVPDLAPYYRSARCVIAPMVSGSGTSIKTIEALALGKPFVGTSKAFRGMPVEQIHATGVRSYDSPRDFADGVVDVLSHEERASARSRAAYDCVFSTQANFASRDKAVECATAAKK